MFPDDFFFIFPIPSTPSSCPCSPQLQHRKPPILYLRAHLTPLSLPKMPTSITLPENSHRISPCPSIIQGNLRETGSNQSAYTCASCGIAIMARMASHIKIQCFICHCVRPFRPRINEQYCRMRECWVCDKAVQVDNALTRCRRCGNPWDGTENIVWRKCHGWAFGEEVVDMDEEILALKRYNQEIMRCYEEGDRTRECVEV